MKFTKIVMMALSILGLLSSVAEASIWGSGVSMGQGSCQYEQDIGDNATSIQDSIDELKEKKDDLKDKIKDLKSDVLKLKAEVSSGKTKVSLFGLKKDVLNFVDNHISQAKSCCQY